MKRQWGPTRQETEMTGQTQSTRRQNVCVMHTGCYRSRAYKVIWFAPNTSLPNAWVSEREVDGRTLRPPVSIPTLFRTLPFLLFVLVSKFENGADPPEKLCQSNHKILEMPNNPEERPASHQRTSRGPLSEELLKCPLRIASLEMEPLATALTKASTRKPARPESVGEASSAAAVVTASPMLQAFLAKLIVDASLLRVGQNFVSLGNVGELFRGPLLFLLILVRVVLESQLPGIYQVCHTQQRFLSLLCRF